MLFSAALLAQAEQLIHNFRRANQRFAVAESCTGGLIAGLLTSVSGASDVLERGFVTYANEAKVEMLGVPASILDTFGAVSEETARAMAEGALSRSRADVAASVTGIAGPGGGSDLKPVGLVHMALALKTGSTVHERHLFDGDRERIRLQAVQAVLRMTGAFSAL